MWEELLLKEKLTPKEKLAFFRGLLKHEMEVLNQYCAQGELPRKFRVELCHLHSILFIYYTVDPLMAEAILTINPERLSFLQGLAAKITVRDKEYSLYSNSTAWKIVKQRITSRFPEVTEEEIEGFKGQRGKFVEYLSQKTGKSKETIDRALSDCGWTPTEEIPAFLRQIGP